MLLSLFGRKDKTNEQDNNPVSPSSLPRAVAFVDYESWYVSLKTTYAIAPDIKGWFEELNRHYQLIDVTFFADFSHRSLADELRRIRPYTNKIIDTRSPNGVEKDYTDFIMLDNIYQKALSASDIQTFILFSGDGHFSSVVAFLKNFYHKNVVVYGIQDCFSAQLREAASETVTLPDEKQLNRGIYQTIFDYLRRASVPTYDGALQYVADKHKNVSRKTVQNAMDLLEKREVLSQHNLPGSKGKQLFISWENAEEWLDVPLAEYLAQPVEPLRPNNRNERTEGRRPDEANRHHEHGDQPHFQLKDAHGSPDRKQNQPAQKQKPEEKKQPEKQPPKQTPPQESRPQKADGQKDPAPQNPPKAKETQKPNANEQPDKVPQKNGADAGKARTEKAKQPSSEPQGSKPQSGIPQGGKDEKQEQKQQQPQQKKSGGRSSEKKKAEPETAQEPKAEKPKPGSKKKKLKTDAHKAENKTDSKPETVNAEKPADENELPLLAQQAKQENQPRKKQKQPSGQQAGEPKAEPKPNQGPKKSEPEPVIAESKAEGKAEDKAEGSTASGDKPKASGRRRRRSGSKPKTPAESAPEANASGKPEKENG
ncbi:MAG: NYN domain-containing protein [Clostridia bacterium]|nr:NYN domain-containing protein [Clostridia bacterium]